MSGRIVVGVDGSPASKLALSWALDEARLRGDSVVAVHAWMHPFPATSGFPGGLVAPVDDNMVEAVRTADEHLLEGVVSDANTHDAKVEQRLVEGPAAWTLIEQAEGAELLVVGSRGHGGFAGVLLGSVSQRCAHYAPCPVMVVRAPEEEHEIREM